LARWRQAAEAAKRCDDEREVLLRAALKKMKKADLVELTLRMARESKATEWLLEREIGLDKPVDVLVHDIEVAIERATQVDEQQLNYNFEYDGDAYEAVQRGLSQLVQKGKLEEAKALALKLVQKGSYQMECSDEGLMQEEIELCLRPVISAVADSADGPEWARNMLRSDRIGVLCYRELTAVAGLRK